MVLTWFVGVHGLASGYGTAAFLRSGIIPDVTTAAQRAEGSGDLMEFAELFRRVELQAMATAQHVTFPLAVAQVLLSALLMVSSGLAMGGRRGARTLALQALAANALLAVVGYAL